jgi:hypothetical protein
MSHLNKDILDGFYSAFSQKDTNRMLSYYSADVLFHDPVFGSLQGEQVAAMWRMLLERGGDDLHVTHRILSLNKDGGQVEWTARYNFGPRKRPVVNRIIATLWIANGKIYQHEDHFDFWKWSRQALGLPGYLLGWTGYLRLKVRGMAKKGLEKVSK